MTLTRRSFLSMTAIATTLAAAAACGSKDSGGTAAGASGGPSAEASSGTVRDANADLVIWADEKKAPSIQEFATKWGQDQGGLTVAVQVVAENLQENFVTADSTGNGPDIVIGAHDWIGKFVQNNAITPVQLDDAAKSNYSDMALKAVTYNGQTYGAPYSVEALVLYVNKAVTSQVAPTTIEEVVEAGKAAGTEEILALPVGQKGDGYHMQPLYSSAGGYLFGTNADGSYNLADVGVGTESSVTAGTKIAELASQGALKTSITTDNAVNLFTDGKSPFLVSGPWSLATIKTAGIDYAIAKIPGFAGMGDAVPFAGVNVFYVAANGKNRTIAESFVADVAKDSTVAEAMFAKNELPPAQKDLVEKLKSSNPDMATLADIASAAAPMPSIPQMAAIWPSLGQAEANIIAGKDPKSEMEAAGTAIKSAPGP